MLTYINGLVSAVELRWFWISWRKNHISYGRGNQHGQNVIGWYEDLSPKSIEIMKISSFGNISGLWIIPAVYYISGVCEFLHIGLRYTRFRNSFVCFDVFVCRRLLHNSHII